MRGSDTYRVLSGCGKQLHTVLFVSVPEISYRFAQKRMKHMHTYELSRKDENKL